MKKILLKSIITSMVLLSGGLAAQTLTLGSNEDGGEQECNLGLKAGAVVEIKPDGGLVVRVDDTLKTCIPGGGGSVDAGAVSLSVTPASVDSADTSITVSWVIPSPPYTCTLTRNNATFLSDSQIRNIGNANSVADTVSSNTTYRMDCNDPNDGEPLGAYATTLVEFDGGTVDPTPGSACAQQVSGTSRVSPITVNRDGSDISAVTYEDVLGEWGAKSATVKFALGPNQYVSLPFDPANRSDDFASISWNQRHNSPSQIRMSVSTCISAPMQANTISQKNDGNICYVQTSGSSGAFNMRTRDTTIGCVVQPGTTYFLNISFMNEDGSFGCTNASGCELLIVENS